MKLLKLSYKDFKGQTREFDFGGSNADIYGANGVGKTTVFDAFTWLLFGKDSKGAELSEDIKTKGQMDNGVEHSVEATLELDDGATMTLKRLFREVYTKKRGQATSQFSGHTTDYSVNGVPAKKKEYEAAIKGIILEEKFRLITNPLHFKSLDWKVRRSMLLEICGDVSDSDVIAGNSELAGLSDRLGKHSVDDFRKIIAAQRAKVNDELKKIPVRIDEVTKGLPDVDGLSEETVKGALEKFRAMQSAKHDEIAKIKNGGAISEKRAALSKIWPKKNAIENHYNLELNRKTLEVQSVLAGLKNEDMKLENIRDLTWDRREAVNKEIELQKKKVEKKREDWHKENNKPFGMSDICPTCGQKMPKEILEEAKKSFNVQKSDALTKINMEGKEEAQKLRELEAKAASMTKEIEELTNKVIELNEKMDAAEKSLVKPMDYHDDEEYKALAAEEAAINEEIKSLEAGTLSSVEKVEGEIRDIDALINSNQERLATLNKRKDGEKRLKELKAQQKELAAEFEDLEQALYLTDTFIKTKVSMLDERINSKFQIAQFKMFDVQVNGGLSECCDILYEGVERMSTSQEIKAGLDIIRTLSAHYGIAAPVFVDNSESVTELPEMECQVIRLIVSPDDKELRVTEG